MNPLLGIGVLGSNGSTLRFEASFGLGPDVRVRHSEERAAVFLDFPYELSALQDVPLAVLSARSRLLCEVAGHTVATALPPLSSFGVEGRGAPSHPDIAGASALVQVGLDEGLLGDSSAWIAVQDGRAHAMGFGYSATRPDVEIGGRYDLVSQYLCGRMPFAEFIEDGECRGAIDAIAMLQGLLHMDSYTDSARVVFPAVDLACAIWVQRRQRPLLDDLVKSLATLL